MPTREGRIIKIISNQVSVAFEDDLCVCQPRGKLRQLGRPLVGDYVVVDEENTITSLLPRENQLLRPAIANVDQALLVTACDKPAFSDKLLHRFLFLVELAHINPIIVLTKTDLVDASFVQTLVDRYQKMGFIITRNLDELVPHLKGKISVLCGQSGAGKSTLLNKIEPSFALKTQEISKALGRGKHTTRHCELHEVASGFVADTPGFSSLDFNLVDTSKFALCLSPFQAYLGQCRFRDCKHHQEPGCAIKQAVEDGLIDRQYYEDYVSVLEGVYNE